MIKARQAKLIAFLEKMEMKYNIVDGEVVIRFYETTDPTGFRFKHVMAKSLPDLRDKLHARVKQGTSTFEQLIGFIAAQDCCESQTPLSTMIKKAAATHDIKVVDVPIVETNISDFYGLPEIKK